MAPGEYYFLDQNVARQPTSEMTKPKSAQMQPTNSNSSIYSTRSSLSNTLSTTSSNTSYQDTNFNGSPFPVTGNFVEGNFAEGNFAEGNFVEDNFAEDNFIDPSKIVLNSPPPPAMAFFDSTSSKPYENTDLYYPPLQNQTSQQTPLSLGWNETMDTSKFYELNVGDLKEPRLELREEYWSDNPYFPLTVYLDKAIEPVKNPHACLYPGHTCWKDNTRRSFRRPADLDRHYKVVHKALGCETFLCDHPRCNRHGDPFTRRDHARDHYRDYHKEDLGALKRDKAKDKAETDAEWQAKQQQWINDRNIDSRWWRCSKCLDRVWVEKNEWNCPRCNKNCEENRIQGRSERSNTQYTSSYPSCHDCKGTGLTVDSLGLPIECSFCTSFSNTSSYNTQAWPESQY